MSLPFIEPILALLGQNGTYLLKCVIFIDVPLKSPARFHTFNTKIIDIEDPILAPYSRGYPS